MHSANKNSLLVIVTFVTYFLQFNGTTTNGLADFDLTSGDQAARSQNSSLRSSSQQSHHSRFETTTQPLEAKTLPPDVANTLEHIVGQLDILTQVSCGCSYVERTLCCCQYFSHIIG
jgi:hypothetical protein